MNSEHKLYRFLYPIVCFFFSILYRVKPIGRENIPENGAIYCANHSNWADPFLLIFAVKKDRQLHIMAKVELFRIKIIGWILKKLGMIPVDRSTADVNAIMSSLRYLRAGENICIFPEGTRISEDFSVAAKTGAVKIADKSRKPIVPVYIPRKKRLFGSVKLVIGKPYYINEERKRLSQEEYDALAQDMMVTIKALDPESK